jgi:hypothetical protein
LKTTLRRAITGQTEGIAQILDVIGELSVYETHSVFTGDFNDGQLRQKGKTLGNDVTHGKSFF